MLNPNINQIHGADGQARGVGHMWRCEFCLRKWWLQLISASRWETFIKVFLLRNPSFHTGVQAKYANLWIVLEREGGVKWSVHPALSSYVYNPIVIWRVRQPYGREMLLLLAEISRIAATVRETGSQRSNSHPHEQYSPVGGDFGFSRRFSSTSPGLWCLLPHFFLFSPSPVCGGSLPGMILSWTVVIPERPVSAHWGP